MRVSPALVATLAAATVLSIVPATSSHANTAQLVLGASGDAWEQAPPGFDAELQRMIRSQPFELCRLLHDEEVELVTDRAATALLEDTSVKLLDAGTIRTVFPDRPAIDAAAIRQAFVAVAETMETRRQLALVEHRGSWSRYEQIELDRIRALLDSDEIETYRPYLIRAFRWRDRPTRVAVNVCGAFVRTTVDTEASPNPKPERAAALVFLPREPRGSFPQWIQAVVPPAPMLGS